MDFSFDNGRFWQENVNLNMSLSSFSIKKLGVKDDEEPAVTVPDSGYLRYCKVTM